MLSDDVKDWVGTHNFLKVRIILCRSGSISIRVQCSADNASYDVNLPTLHLNS